MFEKGIKHQVQLENGFVYTGYILESDNDSVVINTDIDGEIYLKKSDISRARKIDE